MNKYQQLQKFYHTLSPHDSSELLNFSNLTIRKFDHNGRLERPFFAIACKLVEISQSTGNSFIVMNTASHNPPGYNGLKVESFEELKIDEEQVSKIINDPKETLHLLKRVCLQENTKQKSVFYLGRDKRLTSLGLSNILRKVLAVLGRRVIDLGQRTTPQVFSLSQFMHSHQQTTNTIQITNKYFQIIRQHFCEAIKLIQINLDRKWRKKSVCLDFANGVGGESFKNYSFLQDYLQIFSVNYQRFDLPNVQCGAEWVYKYFKKTFKVPYLINYPKAEQYYFFDGDSDRIIAKIGEQNLIMDGDDFSGCFVRLVRHLFDSMDLKDQEIGTVVNILSNDSLVKYLSTVNVAVEQVAVGVKYAFAAIKKYEIGCYFEICGHGNLYFSQKMRLRLGQLQQKYWQARLLICLDALSRNNSRGYAFHDMLTMQIYLFYFIGQSPYLFPKSYNLTKQYALENPQIYQNSRHGKKLLQKPIQLILITKALQQQYKEESILVRKSTTTSHLNISIQGERKRCQLILQRFQQAFMRQMNGTK